MYRHRAHDIYLFKVRPGGAVTLPPMSQMNNQSPRAQCPGQCCTDLWKNTRKMTHPWAVISGLLAIKPQLCLTAVLACAR